MLPNEEKQWYGHFFSQELFFIKSSLHLKILSQKHLFPIWQSRDLHELELSILAGARITNLLLGKRVLAWSIGFSLISGRERWEFFMGFSVFSFSINSLIKLMIALLPMSVLEQTQSPVLKQEGSIFGTCPCQSLLISPQYFLLLTVMLFCSIFYSTSTWSSLMSRVMGSGIGGNGKGSAEKRNWTGSYGCATSHAASTVGEKWGTRADGWIWRRAGWKRGQEREQAKQGKQNSNCPPAVSVQSHSSTRQTSIKYSSGLGSSVSSAQMVSAAVHLRANASVS